MWKLHQFLEKDWSLVEFVFKGNRYFHGNDISKKWKSVKHEFCSKQICYRSRKAASNFWDYDIWQGKYRQEQKKSVCLISNKSRKHFKPCFLFNDIKWLKLLQRIPKCVLKLYFEALKVLLVCVFLISRTRLFLTITSIINLEQLSISNAFSKILKTAQ